jgi:hypothetical protein
MPKHEMKRSLIPAWLAPVAVAGLLAACGGGDREPAADAGTQGNAPATPPPAAESPPAAEGPPAGAAQTPGDTPAAGATGAAAPAPKPASPAPGAAAGGGAPDDPKLIALGDSVFHGQAGGGTCYACHGQDAKGSGVGPNLTDGEWLNTDECGKGATQIDLPVSDFGLCQAYSSAS